MKDYKKYQHVEKLGSDEVDGILIGDVYVFPKIDGTNAHVWTDDNGFFHCGSRNRELSLDKDNAGFMAWATQQDNLGELAESLPGCHIFGEWLVPHSLKTYREDAWRQFYVFDISYEDDTCGTVHFHYDKVRECCEEHSVNYIAPIRIIHNPTVDNIMRTLDANTFLIEDGKGAGEGVVLKNYGFVNKYGRQTWAKVVTSEFKEKHHKEMGAPITKGTDMVEEKIIDDYCTEAMIRKTYDKIRVERGGWNSKCIPQLLSTVFHDLVVEHSWDICKQYKMPTVDFKNLNRFCVIKIKSTLPEIF